MNQLASLLGILLGVVAVVMGDGYGHGGYGHGGHGHGGYGHGGYGHGGYGHGGYGHDSYDDGAYGTGNFAYGYYQPYGAGAVKVSREGYDEAYNINFKAGGGGYHH